MFVTICDRCERILDNNVDSVEIEYNYNKRNSHLGKHKKVHLCEYCYEDIFGSQLEQLQQQGDIKW